MGLELALFALAGCFLGTATGLLPGLHANTIALLATGIPLPATSLIVLIASMSTTHTFLDFIPSVMLGAPDDETFLATLPGHRLLKKGKGFMAIRLTIAGGLVAGIGSIAIAPAFVLFIENNASFLSKSVPFVLAAILAAMALDEKGPKKKAEATAVIALSGLLGMLALKSSIPLQQPLFCLATGFFGASTLADSITKRSRLKKQVEKRFYIKKGRLAKNALLAVLGGWLVSLMPGIGASQAAFIARKAIGRIKTADYLVMLGGVNTSTAILSLFVLFAWNKARTGAAAAISQIAEFGMKELLLATAACLVAIGFASIATDLLSRPVAKLLQSFDYRKANTAVLCLVTALVLWFSGPLGAAFYATAASIGLVAIRTNTKRTNCMAFLMAPTIMNYFQGI